MTRRTKADVWMPIVIGDYLKHTSRLTAEQHGAYLLLLMDSWINGPPPDLDTALMNVTRITDARAWRAARPVLQAFFDVVDGQWRHHRLEADLAAWKLRQASYSDRARAGGRAKAQRNARLERADGVLEAPAKHPKSSAKPLPKSCSSSGESEEDPDRSSSDLSGAGVRARFAGPPEIRMAFAAECGDGFAWSYIDPCGWSDAERALIPATTTAAAKILERGRPILRRLELSVMEKAHG